MKTNRLINEKSPYLLQHARNPVDWYPWGEEAFEKARLEDKPVFLSIGYSTCHWCHVMERESFEDERVAALLNETFINIKVDREERPDIDAVYMKVCQLMTKSGGWPLTIMMTPDQKPFFADTYIPRETRYGRVGLTEMIPEVQTLWRTRREEVLSAASDITRALLHDRPAKPRDVGEETLHRAYRSLAMSFDKTFGGFGRQPKFPSPHNFLFLLRYWKRTGETQALHMVEQTIRMMRQGGIYDQIGFGFHRYATDAGWVLPHFEKMLYDQALMAMAVVELYQATADPAYKTLAHEIFTYVLRDMTDAGGGFYSAEDADSEGKEGKFYLWSEEEIRRVLGKEDAELFLMHYRHESDLALPGMHELPEGYFIPHLGPGAGGKDAFLSLEGRQDEIRRKLFDIRKQRVHPHKDDKILTDWNGLMIAALALGARVLDEPSYLEAALKAMSFIQEKMTAAGGRLLHRFRDGQASIDAHADDYAFIIWALLELYETAFDVGHLTKALEYQSHLSAFFRDERDGGLFFTPTDAEKLLTRPKELYDGAMPSGNSVAFHNSLRLARITADGDMDETAHEIYRAFGEQADAMPTAFTHFLCGLDFAIGPASEVVIVGEGAQPETRAMLTALRGLYAPNKVVLLLNNENRAEFATLAPWVHEHKESGGKPTAYVCSNFTCALPTNDPEKMLELLLKDGERS